MIGSPPLWKLLLAAGVAGVAKAAPWVLAALVVRRTRSGEGPG